VVFILPAFEVVAVSAEGHEVGNLVVSLIAVNVVNSHLAVMLRDKATAFTVVFLVGNPRALNVGLGHYVLCVAAVVNPTLIALLIV
jgi:hypothetical protein